MGLSMCSELMVRIFFDNYSTSGDTSAALGIKKINLSKPMHTKKLGLFMNTREFKKEF